MAIRGYNQPQKFITEISTFGWNRQLTAILVAASLHAEGTYET